MKVGIKVIAWANGQPFVEGGFWLATYNPDAFQGRGHCTWTADPKEALQFDTAAEAFKCWTQVSTVRPYRPDGQPNRPLTAFTVEVLNLS